MRPAQIVGISFMVVAGFCGVALARPVDRVEQPITDPNLSMGSEGSYVDASGAGGVQTAQPLVDPDSSRRRLGNSGIILV